MNKPPEFFVGAIYETFDHQKVVCLKNDAPNQTFPNIVMNIDNGKVYSVNYLGQETGYVHKTLYSTVNDIKDNCAMGVPIAVKVYESNDIIRMIPHDENEEALSNAILVNEQVKEYRMREKVLKELQNGSMVILDPTPEVLQKGGTEMPKFHWHVIGPVIFIVLAILFTLGIVL